MVLEIWPGIDDLSVSDYERWMDMAMVYLVVSKHYGSTGWYKELEFFSRRVSTESDGVRDMVTFFQAFYLGLSYGNFEVYMDVVIRRTLGF